MLAAKTATFTFDLVFVFLLAAIVLFVLGSALLERFVKARGWFVPIGLACFAAAVLVEWKF